MKSMDIMKKCFEETMKKKIMLFVAEAKNMDISKQGIP
jgi:hypothetical protein